MWFYNGSPIEEIPDGYFGFIYLIENIETGKKYLGRKYFTASKTRQVKGKKKKSRVESDWKDYYGSSEILLKDIEALGKEKFVRKIIRLCKTRGETNYWEAKLQFKLNVLEETLADGSPAWYNGNILVKFTRKNIGAIDSTETLVL